MAWTTKIPTTPGWKYLRSNKTAPWCCKFVNPDFEVASFNAWDEMEWVPINSYICEWWDAPIPAPGESWSVDEILKYKWYCEQNKFDFNTHLRSPIFGIAPITERNKKEAK